MNYACFQPQDLLIKGKFGESNRKLWLVTTVIKLLYSHTMLLEHQSPQARVKKYYSTHNYFPISESINYKTNSLFGVA